MRTIKKILLVVSALIVILVAGFFCYIACEGNCLPTTKTNQELDFNVNGRHILSNNDSTKIEITNDQPCLLKALSGCSFKLIFNQETYLSSPTIKDFSNSQEYLELTLTPGKKQTIVFNNLTDTRAIFTSDSAITITFYPNQTQKIFPLIFSAIITVISTYLLFKIVKNFKKLKKPTT